MGLAFVAALIILCIDFNAQEHGSLFPIAAIMLCCFALFDAPHPRTMLYFNGQPIARGGVIVAVIQPM
jgi:hypothetical protein